MTLFRIAYALDPVASAGLARDAQRIHSMLMAALPAHSADARERAGLIWRLDAEGNGHRLLVQTTAEDFGAAVLTTSAGIRQALGMTDVSDHLNDVESGDIVRFRLRANPVRWVGRRDGGGKRAGLRDHGEITDWLARRLAGAATPAIEPFSGAADVAVFDETPVIVKPRGAVFTCVDLHGTLVVDDATRLTELVASGVGRGKAFGMGLLQVHPVGR